MKIFHCRGSAVVHPRRACDSNTACTLNISTLHLSLSIYPSHLYINTRLNQDFCLNMLVSQLSVFIHFYIAETKNEVKIEIDNQRATFQRYVDVYINLYYLNVFGLSFSQLDIYVCQCCYVLTVITIPSPVFPRLCSVSNPVFRRGRMILSVSPSSMRMFSQSVLQHLHRRSVCSDLRFSASVL